MLWVQSTTKDYIRAAKKLESISQLFIQQVFSNHNSASIHNFRTQTQENNTAFKAYLYSMGTQHRNLHPAGWPIQFCGPTQEPVLATANTGKTLERLWKKCWKHKWTGTGRVEISNRYTVWLYPDQLLALKGEPLNSVFSTDGTFIPASAAPHCGVCVWEREMHILKTQIHTKLLI